MCCVKGKKGWSAPKCCRASPYTVQEEFQIGSIIQYTICYMLNTIAVRGNTCTEKRARRATSTLWMSALQNYVYSYTTQEHQKQQQLMYFTTVIVVLYWRVHGSFLNSQRPLIVPPRYSRRQSTTKPRRFFSRPGDEENIASFGFGRSCDKIWSDAVSRQVKIYSSPEPSFEN